MIRISIIALIIACLFSSCFIQKKTKISVAEIETDYGMIEIELYEGTPKHKENFIKLANENFYNGVLFHRVIKDFMIQTGDPESKNAKPGQMLGNGGPGYQIDAEIDTAYFHVKGAIAAARMGDNVNPEKKSSGSQFYIVQGKKFTDNDLNRIEMRTNKKLSQRQRNAYTNIGGTPHLDGAYTVFGEILNGLNVVDSIAAASTDRRDRPEVDIKIKSVKIKTKRVKR